MKRTLARGLILWTAYTVGHWIGWARGEVYGKREALIDAAAGRPLP